MRPFAILRSLFNSKKSGESFFNDILEYLFYDALAINRKGNGDFYGKLNCRIPFLNGGLFEPIGDYDWVNTHINLPDSLFSHKTSLTEDGDGILDVFDLYNFTINEAEPLETEVAVDPEMLGKIFENLLPENVRHGSGTYYTPRVIVAYMCQQSLINYLATHLSEPGAIATGFSDPAAASAGGMAVPRDEIETFIRFGSQAADYTEGGAAKDKDKYLPESIRAHAPKIDSLLKKITVCDPAIGSGAFPVGMMHEIVKAREALRAFGSGSPPYEGGVAAASADGVVLSSVPPKSQYQLKRETIENCLYGVDIDPGAVEIAKLRLWLSLIVDEADFQNIEPLPNLDYKIMQGNSLLDEFHGVRLVDEKMFERPGFDKDARVAEINEEIRNLEIDLKKANVGKQSPVFVLTERKIKELRNEKTALLDGDSTFQNGLYAEDNETQKKLDDLKAAIKQFFGEADAHKKKTLREKIENLEWEFIHAKLTEDGKTEEFDSLAEAQKSRRKNYFLWQLNFPDVFQKGGFDVVIGNPPYFPISTLADSAKAQLENSGFETFSRGSDIYCLFYEKAFGILRKKAEICLITSNRFCFTNYGIDLRNFLAKRNVLQLINFNEVNIFETVNVGSLIGLVEKSGPSDQPVKTLDFKEADFIYSLSETVEITSSAIDKQFFNSSPWSFGQNDSQRIKRKLDLKGTPFVDWRNISINRGITTGLNEVFIVSETTRNELVAKDPKCAEILLPVLKGANVKRFSIVPSRQYLIYRVL